jgi:hypothetical protein
MMPETYARLKRRTPEKGEAMVEMAALMAVGLVLLLCGGWSLRHRSWEAGVPAVESFFLSQADGGGVRRVGIDRIFGRFNACVAVAFGLLCIAIGAMGLIGA